MTDVAVNADRGGGREAEFDVALLTDVGTERGHNEDACGHWVENPGSGVFVVADGVGGQEGGEVASAMAVDVTLSAYRESPVSWGVAKRLYRAVQQANIEIHDRAVVVTELRYMSTTVTAFAVQGGVAYCAHVGDSRMYLLRRAKLTQVTKDHTVAADRMRLGLISKERAKTHPERSTLTRSLGRDLIVAVDKITLSLMQGDLLLSCSDGLHNVLGEEEIASLLGRSRPEEACRALVDAANARGTADNLTACVFSMLAETPMREEPLGWRTRLKKLLRQA